MRASWLFALALSAAVFAPHATQATDQRDGLIQALKGLGVALEVGRIQEVKTLVARVKFENRLLLSQDKLNKEASESIVRLLEYVDLLDLSSELMRRGNACFVGYGFDGAACENAAQAILKQARVQLAKPVSITSFSTQMEVVQELMLPLLGEAQAATISAIIALSK